MQNCSEEQLSVMRTVNLFRFDCCSAIAANVATHAECRWDLCFFFRLKPLDVEFMRRLHDKVNIIPLIAKADTMTPDECREFKKTVSTTRVHVLII